MTRLMISGAALALLAGCSQGYEIQPGEWEMTMEVDELSVPGADPAMRQQIESQLPPPETTTVCISEAEARDPDGGLFAQGSEDCEAEEFRMADGTMELDATCTGAELPGEMRMRLNGSYELTSIETDLEMEVEVPQLGTMTMTGTMNAEHQSDEC